MNKRGRVVLIQGGAGSVVTNLGSQRVYPRTSRKLGASRLAVGRAHNAACRVVLR